MSSPSGAGDIWKENPWVLPVVGGIADVAAFVLAGWVAGLVGIAILFIIAFIMILRSLIRRTRQLSDVLQAQESPAPLDHDRSESPTEASEETATPAREHAPEADVRDAAEGTAEEDSPLPEALDAALSGDHRRVRELLIPWMNSTDVEEEKIRRQALALGLALRAGDPEARDPLRALADENPEEGTVVTWLVLALKALGERTAAIQELETRIPHAGRAQLHLRLQLAQTLREAGMPERALEEMDGVLESEPPQDSRGSARVLAERGYALEALDRMAEAFTAFESALHHDPVQEGLRFHLAYEYGERDWEELAVIHYEALLSTQPMNNSALNNIGVQLRSLGVLLRGTEMLKRGAEHGSSLAAANLAGHLITAGFEAEAEAWIDKGRELPDPHPNLASATARLHSLNTEEDQTLESARQRGHEARDLLRSFHQLSPPSLPSGQWEFSTGDVMSLSTEGLSAVGQVGEDLKKKKITLTRAGTLFTVTWSEGVLPRRESQGIGQVGTARIEVLMKRSSPAGPLWILRGWPKPSDS
ncbi:MAG: tetratricopeptide repeat protein [Acidobacteriota bacterium]